MKITEHFSLAELTRSDTAKRQGLDNTPNAAELENIRKTAEMLEKIRAHVGAAVVVSSCFRSERVNRAVGGSATSAHRYGSAADIDAVGYTSGQLARKIVEMQQKGLLTFDQVILEFPERGAGAWVHVGFRWASPMRGQVLTATKQGGKTVYLSGLRG